MSIFVHFILMFALVYFQVMLYSTIPWIALHKIHDLHFWHMIVFKCVKDVEHYDIYISFTSVQK